MSIDDDQERAEATSYENESGLARTVTIPLREYDELKAEQHFIKITEKRRRNVQDKKDN